MEDEEDDDEHADEEKDDNAHDAHLIQAVAPPLLRVGEPSAADKKERKAPRRGKPDGRRDGGTHPGAAE